MAATALVSVRKGDRVRVFHPRMFGVIKEGVVDTVGTKYVWIDFGALNGGLFRVTPKHVVEVIS